MVGVLVLVFVVFGLVMIDFMIIELDVRVIVNIFVIWVVFVFLVGVLVF